MQEALSVRVSFKEWGVRFFERLWYAPKWYDGWLIVILLPFSLFYGTLAWLYRRWNKPKKMGIAIVSIGNIIVGGSGKTPMAIALARRQEKAAVVLRGYGRKSKGVHIVSRWGAIECDVACSGDEAMLLAQKLPKASVIVAEDRLKGIEVAKELGAQVLFLDDGFSKSQIEKFDLLLYPSSIRNPLPLPAGPFREFWFQKSHADYIAQEGRDFKRIVVCDGCGEAMLLVSAIANPQRLFAYIPKASIKGVYFLPDHSWFDPEAIEQAMRRSGVRMILTTEKDWIKLQPYGFKAAILRLHLEVDDRLIQSVDAYIKSAKNIPKEEYAKKDAGCSDTP